MNSWLKPNLRSQQGFTLTQVLVSIGIALFVLATSVGYALSVQKEEQNQKLNADKATLESVSRTYHLVNNRYPAKYTVNIGLESEGTALKQIFDAIKSEMNLNLTDDEINERFKPIDTDLLINATYLQKLNTDGEFIIDTLTGSVYHESEFTDGKLIGGTKDDLEDSTGINIKLTVAGIADLVKDGNEMSKINTTLAVDGKNIVGGKGTMTLAIVVSEITDSGLNTEITDLSSKLGPTADIEVGDLRYLGGNKLLVHYAESGLVKYKVVDF